MATSLESDELLSYSELVDALDSASRQCIWYKSWSGSRCDVEMSADKMDSGLNLLRAISEKNYPTNEAVLEALAYIARDACCDQFHQDMVHNLKTDQRLASKWQAEMSDYPYPIPRTSREAQRTQIIDTKLTRQAIAMCPKAEGVVENEEGLETGDLAALLEKRRKRESSSPFRKHTRLPSETLASKLLEPMPSKDVEKRQAGKLGFIYLFTQKSLEGMVKIGCTEVGVKGRLTYWSKCGHGEPNLIQSFSGVPHPKRVEMLIHFEFLESWRRERHCKTHQCSHIEWFKVDPEVAVIVAGQWVAWVKLTQPYDKIGDLKGQWRSMLQWLISWDIPITSSLLLDLHKLEVDTALADTMLESWDLEPRTNRGGPVVLKTERCEITDPTATSFKQRRED